MRIINTVRLCLRLRLRLLIPCAAIASVAMAVISGCATPDPEQRFVATVPDRATFPKVADLLVHRCGSLDCHGSRYRNLRLYGGLGLRLAPTDRPTSDLNSTTALEYDEDFLSIVGLEPEVLSTVVQEGGANPERLSLVRKARGSEHHKGFSLFVEGDEQDRCLLSWLSGHTDEALCAHATANAF